ncbi:glycosyltransferase family A protein [Hymenobacter lapidarius]|uniref:glycosyltransferase family A protein n=1 Tax=Hymenobacter lapidarius TaxID=1908237 RepID=UPI001EFC0B51|nr:glycosyltransferase family A protein [Hymenobacter lapidarius]
MVDDGSKDYTAVVVARFADPHLCYYPKQNAERGAARNYDLAHAQDEYVIFLDSDDRFYPKHLATLYAKTLVHLIRLGC